jgi:hypothetical protein
MVDFATSGMPIQPLDPFEGTSGYGLPSLPEQQQVQAVQSGVDPAQQADKDRRRQTRGRALEALAIGLATFASQDPGKTAARFIEQQIRQRQMQRELESNEKLVQQRLAHQSGERAMDREHSTAQQAAGFEQQDKIQSAGFEHDIETQTSSQEFRTAERTASQEFRLVEQEKDHLSRLGLTQLRIDAQEKRDKKNHDRARDNAIFANKQDIQNRVAEHMLALGGDDPIANLLSGQKIAHFIAGDAPRSSLSAQDQAVFQSWMEREELNSNVETATSTARLVGEVSSLAMTTETNAAGDAVTVFDEAKWDNVSKMLPESIRHTIEPPEIKAAAIVTDAIKRAEGGEQLSPQEIDQVRQAASIIPGGEEQMRELDRRLGADPSTGMPVAATAEEPVSAPGGRYVPDVFNFSAEGGGARAADLREVGKGVKKLVDFFRPLPPATIRGAEAVGSFTDFGKSGQVAAKAGFAGGKKIYEQLLSHPDITKDTPVWEGDMGDTPEGHIVQDPSNPEVFMFRRGNFFHAVKPIN